MFLFTITAKPKPENTEHKDDGGAYVNAYIDFREEEGAEIIARYYIEDAGWYAEETEDTSWITEKDITKTDKKYKYFNEAKECGSSLIFNRWPNDAEDAEIKH